MINAIRNYFATVEKDAIPQLSVNCVIFGFHERSLKVIVNKLSLAGKEMYFLPGGFVNQAEDLPEAVKRIVYDSTGLQKILLKQFGVFGDASRSFPKEFSLLAKSLGEVEAVVRWFSTRFISICYLAAVDFNKITLKPTEFFDMAEWLPIRNTRILSLDHASIVQSARESLARELPYSPIESNLLPAKFTLPELHVLLEEILDRSIDRANFRRKILKSNQIIKVGTNHSGIRRPADLYTFKYGKKTSVTDNYKLGF